MNKTIGQLPESLVKMIGELPEALALMNDSLLAVEQQGIAYHIKGEVFRRFAEAATQLLADQTQKLKEAAEAAQKAAKASQDAAKGSEDAAAESERQAKEYSGKPPIIDGEHETWWTWDATAQQYKDTAKPSRGDLLLPGFVVKIEDGHLYLVTDTRYNGPKFRLNKNRLEMIVGAA